MWFRRKREDPRVQAWRQFAERLELEDASAAGERLRRWLDVEDVSLDPVYVLQREDQPSLYLFEYLRQRIGPTGSVAQRVSNCLLRSEEAFAQIGIRAHPKRNAVLESLEASRTGSSMVDLPSPCGSAISVFAREPVEASRVVSANVCTILARALVQRGADAVVIGERHVLATFEEAVTEPAGEDPEAMGAKFEKLEMLASDVLALYASLATQPTPPMERAGGRP